MSALRKGLQNERGFTLVEVTIILLVLVILSTIMLPQLGNFNRLARFVVVSEDVGAICATLKKFLDEVMLPGPYAHPGGSPGAGVLAHPPENKVGLLVGPGGVPGIGANLASPTSFNTDAATQIWTVATGKGVPAFAVFADGDTPGAATSFEAAEMQYHLQVNEPWTSVDYHGRYKNVLDDPSVGSFFGWRGPYFNEINAGPWGTRYSVNTFGLHAGDNNGGTDDIFATAVICISFGPNKEANTEANMPGALTHTGGPGPAYLIGGDDIAAILSAMGPF